MKLHERLGLEHFEVDSHLTMLSIAEAERPTTSFDSAWTKLNFAALHGLLALDYYMLDIIPKARTHAYDCLTTAREFLLGEWRNRVETPDGTIEPSWWKEKFPWMGVYQFSLLWGTVLGEWEELAELSSFPTPTACLSMGSKAQDRDWFVAIATVLRGESAEECIPAINRLSAGPRRYGKITADVLRDLLEGDRILLQKNFVELLRQYRKGEFPKDPITKKVCIEASVLKHVAAKRGIEVTVPTEYRDYFVRFE